MSRTIFLHLWGLPVWVALWHLSENCITEYWTRKRVSKMLLEADVAEITSKSLKLRDAYISAGILSPRWSDDALHVAIATVTGCTMFVSWNFQHIVNFRKMPLYSAVNTLQGYGPIAIYSPMEVIGYGKEKEEI